MFSPIVENGLFLSRNLSSLHSLLYKYIHMVPKMQPFLPHANHHGYLPLSTTRIGT